MIFNALDEVLFWDEIDTLKMFMKKNIEQYYPQDYDGFYKNKKEFFNTKILNKEDFIKRLENYCKYGKPTWISGKGEMCDDIDEKTFKKAFLHSKLSNGEKLGIKASQILNNTPWFWDFYANNILHTENNKILELTTGAGLGTTAIMKHMKDTDLYIGADIDFLCTKNADAIAQYYNINGLGITTTLWNLPFEDNIFTSICSNVGLEECREIPTIIKEAYRVLSPKGRIVLHCIDRDKTQSRDLFESYGFTDDEIDYWLKQIRMYSSAEETEKLLSAVGFSFVERKQDNALGYVLVYEK